MLDEVVLEIDVELKSYTSPSSAAAISAAIESEEDLFLDRGVSCGSCILSTIRRRSKSAGGTLYGLLVRNSDIDLCLLTFFRGRYDEGVILRVVLLFLSGVLARGGV